jgi:hypothetical protein
MATNRERESSDAGGFGAKGNIKHPLSLSNKGRLFSGVPAKFFFRFLCVYVLAMPEKKKKRMESPTTHQWMRRGRSYFEGIKSVVLPSTQSFSTSV